MGVSCWKKCLAVFLAVSCLTGTAFAGSWQEKEVVTAEYKDIEYVAKGELFWLEKPRERGISEYFHIREGLMTLPEGAMKGGTRDDEGIKVTDYAHDSYVGQQNYPLIITTGRANKALRGLVDVNGKEILPLTPGKDIVVYEDGFVRLDGALYKDGSPTGAKGVNRRYHAYPDAWDAGSKKEITLINSKGDVLAELPFVDSIFDSAPGIIIGKSNGKDKKRKAYRVWDMGLEEITPVEDGFEDLVVLRKTVTKEGTKTRELEGIFARTRKVGWHIYPYLGDAKFGEPIPVAAKENEYFSASEVAPGYYRLGRPQGDGDYLLDMNARLVNRDANGFAFGGKLYTQEKWTSGRIFIPILSISGGSWWFSAANVKTDGSHLVRLRDMNGQEITTLWESVYLGDNYIVNRYNGETKVVNAEGTVVKRYDSAKRGYIPLVGKKDIPEQEEGQPRQFGVTEWKDWPGGGRYQPFCEGGQWGILDLDTMREHVSPEPRFGQIVKVSDDGKQFWCYFETEKGKFKGIKQFDWVD